MKIFIRNVDQKIAVAVANKMKTPVTFEGTVTLRRVPSNMEIVSSSNAAHNQKDITVFDDEGVRVYEVMLNDIEDTPELLTVLSVIKSSLQDNTSTTYTEDKYWWATDLEFFLRMITVDNERKN